MFYFDWVALNIADLLEHAVDAFEKVANIIEQIHAKES